MAEYSWNGSHHELLLTSPGRRIDIIKKPIKARAGAFITVICEGLGLMGCLFPCAGLTAALVYCRRDADPPPVSNPPEANKKPYLTMHQQEAWQRQAMHSQRRSDRHTQKPLSENNHCDSQLEEREQKVFYSYSMRRRDFLSARWWTCLTVLNLHSLIILDAWVQAERTIKTTLTPYEVDIMNVLANSFLFTHPADRERH